MKNLDYIFRILDNSHTVLDMATINVYDTQEGESAIFALGCGASDDYSGDEMEALGDKIRAAHDYSEVQKILEKLPDRYEVSIENISLSE